MGIYTPAGEDDATMVVAPLDDGSICLWSLTGEPGRKGSIVARSKSGLISVDPVPHTDGRRLKMISTGVTECVSVDNAGKRAYFAVQSGMSTDFQTACNTPVQGTRHAPFSTSVALGWLSPESVKSNARLRRLYMTSIFIRLYLDC